MRGRFLFGPGFWKGGPGPWGGRGRFAGLWGAWGPRAWGGWHWWAGVPGWVGPWRVPLWAAPGPWGAYAPGPYGWPGPAYGMPYGAAGPAEEIDEDDDRGAEYEARLLREEAEALRDQLHEIEKRLRELEEKETKERE